MKHLSEDVIKKYKDNLLSEELSKEIDKHIYSCDECLNKYLSLVDSDIEYLDESFTENVANIIKDINLDNKENTINYTKKYEDKNTSNNDKNIISISNNKKVANRKNKNKLDSKFFAKYALVAASIILITFTGVFTNDKLNNIKTNVSQNNKTNIVYEGSSLITNKITNIFVKIGSPRYASNILRGDGQVE